MHDVVIAGGGPVGSALALALSQGDLTALLLEARSQPTDDRRCIALSYGSRLILERLGVWSALPDLTAIASIHVSQRGAPGRALLTASEGGVPALGFVASYAMLQRVLSAAAEQARGVTLLRGARAIAVASDDGAASVRYASNGAEHEAHARLAAIADGGALAQSAAPQRTREYEQSALVASVRSDRGHRNLAFERFTSQGPIALLPFQDGYSLVWTTAPDEAERLLDLADGSFLEQLQEAFGDRAGRFVAVSGRAAFALGLKVAGPAVSARTVLLGNAAQTLHPVAGQGFNLGLRDAWELAQAAIMAPGRLGELQFLRSYHHARRADRGTAVFLTDSLVRLFSNRSELLRMVRGCGLTALDCASPLKRSFMSRMMFGG
jgi:2-octaprenyl-6-methoxyphenol hydroxylase